MSNFKSFSKIAAVVICLIPLGTTPANAKPGYIACGYLATTYDQSTRGIGPLNVANIPWQDLTDIHCAFASPASTGAVTYVPESAYANLVATAHTCPNNARVYLTVGGAAIGAYASGSAKYDGIWASATGVNLNTFVTNIMSQVNTYHFDGVDIDWEFPNTANTKPAETTQFVSLMQALSTQLHAQTAYDGRPKGLTFFISAGAEICGYDFSAVKSYADYGILSGYDYYAAPLGSPATTYCGPISILSDSNTQYTDCYGNSQVADISDTVNTLTGYGFPTSQLILGCPLYIDDNNQTDVYTVLQSWTPIGFDPGGWGTTEEVYYSSAAGEGYFGTNTAQSFCDKINWAVGKEGMAGISLWEISQAYPYTDAPVAAVWDAIGGASGCLTIANPAATATCIPSTTSTATNTATITATNTASNTPSQTATATATNSPVQTATNTGTNTAVNTSTSTATNSPTTTDTQTVTNTAALTPVITSTFTNTLTNTSSSTATNTPLDTSTQTTTNTETNTITGTIPATDTATNTSTNTPSSTVTNTATNTASSTSTNTAANTVTSTATHSPTDTASSTATKSPVNTATQTVTNTMTSTPTNTASSTATNSATNTASQTAVNTVTNTATMTSTASKTNTPTVTSTTTPTHTPTTTFTQTSTTTVTPTSTPTLSPNIVISEPFPNPSTGSPISFKVQVSGQSTVTLDVFTLAFRKIYSQTAQSDGTQTFQWDLKDISGTQTANGLYYVRIHVAGNQSATKILKVLILK